jgi:hypothetical protein
MDRLERRISKIEQAVSAAKKNHEKKTKALLESYTCHARLHATAVAAIVNVGAPKIDEPLSHAWERVLNHYEIRPEMPGWPPSDLYDLVDIEALNPALKGAFNHIRPRDGFNDQIRAAQRLLQLWFGSEDEATKVPQMFAANPDWLLGFLEYRQRWFGSEDEATKFTEMFSAAPEWLLWYTRVVLLDAPLLKFKLPKLTFNTLKWGSAGYHESRLWPLLPLGRMADGDPVSDEVARSWPFCFNREAEGSKGNAPDSTPRGGEGDDADPPPDIKMMMRSMKVLLHLGAHPEKEKDLSRYDRVRVKRALRSLGLDEDNG